MREVQVEDAFDVTGGDKILVILLHLFSNVCIVQHRHLILTTWPQLLKMTCDILFIYSPWPSPSFLLAKSIVTTQTEFPRLEITHSSLSGSYSPRRSQECTEGTCSCRARKKSGV